MSIPGLGTITSFFYWEIDIVKKVVLQVPTEGKNRCSIYQEQ
jgi:hypothetical protein